MIKELLESSHSNLHLTYDEAKEAVHRRQSLDVTIKRENLPVKIFKRGRELYVVRTDIE